MSAGTDRLLIIAAPGVSRIGKILLPQPAQFLHRPISKDRFAVDVALVDRAELAAVAGHGAMIAEDKVAVGGNRDLGIGTGVGVFVGHVVFVEGVVVDED